MIAVAHRALGQRLVFPQPLAAFLVIERIAHRLAIGAHHRQVHLGDDVGKYPLHLDGVGDHGVDALGARLIQKRYTSPLALGIGF